MKKASKKTLDMVKFFGEQNRELSERIKGWRENESLGGMRVVCACCMRPMTAPGAVLYAPPNEEGACEKTDICVECYAILKLPDSSKQKRRGA